MPVKFEVIEEGDDQPALGLPYQTDFEDGRTNYGFVDLRGRPDEARTIAEAVNSPALQNLLVQLAQPGSKFMSVGCETGETEPTQTGQPFAVGGYIQVAFSDLHGRARDKRWSDQMAQGLHVFLRATVGGHWWEVQFIISVVGTTDIGGPDQVWSPIMFYHGIGPTQAAAKASSEALINAIAEFLRVF